ncbi:MAG: hypothetical protein ACK4YO_02210, partial [Candidatus Altarchaeaceae archaeon]
NVTFYIEVKNIGGGDAKNITIVDDATPFEHISNATVVSGDCTVNTTLNGNIAIFYINDNGTFGAYKTCIFKYLMLVPANTSDGTYRNNASLTYQDFYNTEFNVFAGTDVLVTINLFPDVEKIANDTSLQPGDRVNFTINVRNYGSATMTNGKVIDNLPDGFKCINASGISSGINCSCVNDTTAICNLTDLSGNTISPPLSMWVEAEVNGSAIEGANKNNVFLNGTRPDNQPINRTTDTTVYVNKPKPQLEIYKWTDTIKATPNSTVFYHVLVKNTGDGDAYNLTIADNMDFGEIIDYSTISSGCAECNITNKSCNISLLESGQQCYIKFIVKINGNASDGQHNNTVNVTGKMKDGTEINKTKLNDTESIFIKADVRLTVIKSANTTEVNAGDNVTYTVIVRNDGFNGVYVNVTDNAPFGFICTSNYTNVWIGGNSEKTFTFNCTVNSSATQGNNTVVVNATAENGHTENGTATETVVVNAPDLKIFKSVSKKNVHPNETITYTIIVRNDGTAPAKDIVINDTMDDGLIYNDNVEVDLAASTGCTSVANASILGGAQFNISLLGPGKICKFSYQVNVSGTALGIKNNNVSMSANNMDGSLIPPNANMNDSESVNASADVKLTVTKSANTTEVNAGDNVTYTVIVRNDGFNGAYVNVTDDVPFGFNCTSNYTNEWIDGYSEKTFTFNCTVNSSATQGNNTVTVNGVAENGQTESATATETVVLNKPYLEIIKEAVTGTVEQGKNATYRIIVRNTGKAPVKNITIEDKRPDGTVFNKWVGPSVFRDSAASTGCTDVINTSWTDLPGDIIVANF